MGILPRIDESTGLEFLWLELTNRCNLECIHCYAGSGPDAGHDDKLGYVEYEEILRAASHRGCRNVQFVGGEATLFRELPRLVRYAESVGYTTIELFTNLVSLSKEILTLRDVPGFCIACSFYSVEANIHDAITTRPGSWSKTVANLRKIVASGIPCRVGLIKMELNANGIDRAEQFLRDLGVRNIGLDEVRAFGRALDDVGRSSMSDLCGTCAGKVVCVGADGRMAPCIMSKEWSVGSVINSDFTKLLDGDELANIRGKIAVATERNVITLDTTHMCGPSSCPPCNPGSSCSPYCTPSTSCYPSHSPGCSPKF